VQDAIDRDPDGYRARLEQQRVELTAELAVHQRALREVRQLRADRSDDDEHDPEGAPLSAEWSRIERAHRAVEERLVAVRAALTSVADGRYGVCERCGEPIPAGRLEVRPTATRCVACATVR
jgi:DnaK suppressor protein